MKRLPSYAELAEHAVVVSLPMNVRFRGITTREVLLLRGPAGWGEFGAFPEYDDVESSSWLAAGIEAAYLGQPELIRDVVPVNATVPAIPAEDVAALLTRFPGATTAKVKVAQEGQTLDDDVARVAAVREHVASGAGRCQWEVDRPAGDHGAAGAGGARVRRAALRDVGRTRRRAGGGTTPIAADESIRRAEDPLRVIEAKAADVAILKVAPLGGMRRVLDLAARIPDPGGDLERSRFGGGYVRRGRGGSRVAGGTAACGLGTGGLFVTDVAEPFVPDGGMLAPRRVEVDVASVPLASAERRRWWLDRLRRCHAVLAAG